MSLFAQQLAPIGVSGRALPPARASLAAAIVRLRSAQECLARPLAEIDRIRETATEATALRAEIRRRDDEHAAALTTWIATGSSGAPPVPAPRLLDAERRLAQISAEAEAAATTASVAEAACAGAAEAVKRAMRERDAAVWTVTIEAAEPAFEEMRGIISTASALEARLRGLVLVLRAVGGRDASAGTAPYSAAAAIEGRLAATEGRLAATLRMPRSQPETEPGRQLLERLSSDPLATL